MQNYLNIGRLMQFRMRKFSVGKYEIFISHNKDPYMVNVSHQRWLNIKSFPVLYLREFSKDVAIISHYADS